MAAHSHGYAQPWLHTAMATHSHGYAQPWLRTAMAGTPRPRWDGDGAASAVWFARIDGGPESDFEPESDTQPESGLVLRSDLRQGFHSFRIRLWGRCQMADRAHCWGQNEIRNQIWGQSRNFARIGFWARTGFSATSRSGPTISTLFPIRQNSIGVVSSMVTELL